MVQRSPTFSISTAAGRCDRSHGPAFWADRRARAGAVRAGLTYVVCVRIGRA